LSFVPGRLPELDPDTKEEQMDEALALKRWRDWAEAKVVSGEIATKLHKHHLTVKTEICDGPLPEVMLERCADLPIDLITVDLAKFKMLAPFRQSFSSSRAVYPSVLVARPFKQIRPLNTVAVIGDSVETWRAVEFICALSLPQWAKVTVVQVRQEEAIAVPAPELAAVPAFPAYGGPTPQLPDPTTTKVIDQLHRNGVRVWSNYRVGDPVDEVLAVARQQAADLIVIGAHRQNQQQPFYLDQVTQEIINQAPCSVLAIR
jgi:nucleotide-binding universal stress UspA family protein